MAHPSQQVPARTFSTGQHPAQVYSGQHVSSPSPGPQPNYALPGLPPQGVVPRAQVAAGRAGSFSASNNHSQAHNSQSQPGSPYSNASPGFGPASPSVSTPTTAPSPSYQTLHPAPIQQQSHFAPIVNRNPPPNPNVPTSYAPPNHPTHTAGPATSPTMSSPVTPNPAPTTPSLHQPQQQYSNAAFAPAVNAANAPSTPGAMGPPTGRPQREYEYDPTDSLMGTGVNIRDEEKALEEYYGTDFADQPSVDPGNVSQKEFEAREAERAWNESAHRMAVTRSLEHNDPFLNYGNLHALMEKIAKGYGLELNLDNKNNPQQAHVQKSRNLTDYPAPKLTVATKVGPDGALVQVNGSVVPTECFLADQLNLLSLGTKHRVRDLVAECDKLATHRQQSSHGVIPMGWSEDGIPLDAVGLYDPNEDENGGGENSGGVNGVVNGAGNPAGDGPRGRKRPLNAHSQYLRDYAKAERAAEEERIRKRQKREANEAAAQGGSRAGSNAPGTPGLSAPDPDKAPTKKEQKKIAAQKHDASAESVNSTTAKFLGGGKKKYSWMTGGASAPRTPARVGGGAAGTPASASTSKAPENAPLTAEPRNVMGAWRETSEKGKNIQVRDWIAALERDGKDKLALYKAYNMQRPRS